MEEDFIKRTGRLLEMEYLLNERDKAIHRLENERS